MGELPTGTVTFLFTDVEGSTRLLKQLGPEYAELLSEHHRILRGAFAAHGGTEVDNQGESFFVAFQTAKDAVAAAVDAQRDLFAQMWSAGAEVRVRMGLHTGEPRRGGDRYVGIGVHRAARIGAAGHGGQVLLSSTTKELAEEDLPPGVSIRDLGERRLKDLDQPQRIYQLVIDGLPGEFGPLKTLDVELRRKRRRMYAGAALIGVVAAAVAIPVFALGQGGSSESTVVSGNAVAVIDPGSNKVTGQVAVGNTPEALAVGGGNLWVANTGDQTVTHIDLASENSVHADPVPGVPVSLAVASNAVWLVSRRGDDGTPVLSKIDPRFDTVGRGRPLPNDPGGAASVTAASNGVWVATEGRLQRFDAAGGPVGAPIDTGNSTSSVAVGARAVWSADKFGNSVARIDPETGLVADRTPVGNQPAAVAVGADAVWVADELDNKVVRINPATDSPTEVITVGRFPTGIAVGLGGVWVANSVDGTVSRINPRTNTVVKTITVGGSPQAIAVGGGRVWVSVQNAPAGLGRPAGDVAHIISQFYPHSLDPALAGYAWQIEYATCAKLLNYPDRAGPAGSRLVPEVAAAIPAPTDAGTSYTFTIRHGFRFSPPSNAPVTAQTFKFSIERSLSPKMKGDAYGYFLGDVVGAQAYMAGKAKHISGLSVRGNTLTVRLTHADPLILTQLALPLFCAVPTDTPIDAQGVTTVPAAGPYYIASYNPAQGAVLKRNPNYHGSRPHSLAEIDYTDNVGAAQSVPDIEAGKADYAAGGVPPDQLATLAARYGPGSPAARAGDQRYYTNPEPFLVYLALNTSRPLFKSAALRRAVNYALNRRAITQAAGSSEDGYPGTGRPTDQYLMPGMPGYHAIHVYPLTPDLTRARQLAQGHGGRAVFYTCALPFCHQLAQLLKAELAPIGISVEPQFHDSPLFHDLPAVRGAPFDIAWTGGYIADYPDPSDFLDLLFDGRTIQATNNADISYFNDPTYNRRLDAAAKLTGTRRYRAYQALDSYLTRTAAPGVPLWDGTEQDFYSARIGPGCKINQPVYGVDLAALCLKHRN